MLRVIQLQYADIFITLNKKILPSQKIYFWLIKIKLRKKDKRKVKTAVSVGQQKNKAAQAKQYMAQEEKKNKTL